MAHLVTGVFHALVVGIRLHLPTTDLSLDPSHLNHDGGGHDWVGEVFQEHV